MRMANAILLCTTALILPTKALAEQSSVNAQCQQSYVVKINTQTTFDFNGQQITRHKLNGNLSLKPLNNDLQGLWWGIHFNNIQQTANGEVIADDPSYQIPFAVLRNFNGQLIDFRFPVKLEKSQQDKLKGLAYYLQYSTEWQEKPKQKEIDTIGEYQAIYSFKDKQLIKHKTQYNNLDQVEMTIGTLNSIDIERAEQRFTLSDCWLDSTRGNQKLTTASEGQGFTMETLQTYSVIQTAQKVDSPLWLLPTDISLWQAPTKAEKPLTKEELAALRKALRQDIKNIKITDLRASDLGQWLEKYDAVIDELGVMLLANEFNDKDAMRLFNAIGLLDSENSHKLLINLMQEPELSETQRFRAMRAIAAGTKALTASVADNLIEMLESDHFQGSESLRGSAIMSLGAVLQRRPNNAAAQQVTTALTNRLAGNSNINERASLIASLGNTTNQDLTPTIAKYANDDSERVRANAAFALGQMGNKQAYDTLSNMLHSEGDNRPQQAVLGALQRFELNERDISRVAEMAKVSKSERTRGNAIKALATQQHAKQQVKTELKQILKSEKSKKNFTLVAKTLTQMRNSD
ncbi:HEAT repeat domain-containing protein [Saccharobesus litoralis]|nr:HEAT repeat domain-containing protein [Saccharobesus litoralis]